MTCTSSFVETGHIFKKLMTTHKHTHTHTHTHRRAVVRRVSVLHKTNGNSRQQYNNTKEDSSLPVCHAASLCKYFPTFRKIVVPSRLEKSGLRIARLQRWPWRWRHYDLPDTSVTIYPTTQPKISEDLNLQQHCCENLKSCCNKKTFTIYDRYI
jgi:hypothetical protein